MKTFIGYSSQFKSRTVNIDITQYQTQWPTATPTLMVIRPVDTEMYPVTTALSNGVLTWVPDAYDTNASGILTAVVFMYGPDNSFLGKSKPYFFQIESSPNHSNVPPTKPTNWLELYVATDQEAAAYLGS